ncbi:hypothetical protein [Burkholderia lata]|uniref:hypothetical protein n=1 Tax=Burkholderia lata (strain ATCC 17760 / DSM 23089 / LMG 22485 / NCIMB 9086 / R18194 / 383) TaxID=482957 RepID=UPI0014548AEA|nr:hypothetical protein [Burkholderia lata]VWB73814.1 hypothetical protein BLA15816_03506 [Burkholderia lata]
MAIMSLKDALSAVLKDIEAMSADELRAEHEANMQGDIAVALRELCAFMSADVGVYEYPVAQEVEAVSIPDAMAIAVKALLHENFMGCGNDAAFALAA